MIRDSEEIFREAEIYHGKKLEAINAQLLEALEELVLSSLALLGRVDPSLRAPFIKAIDQARAAIASAKETS